MKILKFFLALSLALFADWVIMILLGCLFSACGAGEFFFCTVYCFIGIMLVVISLLIVASYLAWGEKSRQSHQKSTQSFG